MRWRTGPWKFTAQSVVPSATAGVWPMMKAGSLRSNSRSSALLPLAVTIRGAAKETLTGTVKLPEEPCLPWIWI